MISLQSCSDLAAAAVLTLSNMQDYYQQYGVDWDAKQIEILTRDLMNLDILADDEVVGVMRLCFDETSCTVRDLQVIPLHQSRGIGTQALDQAKLLAQAKGLKRLQLRVFSVSPAVKLYQRYGFTINNQDERFYYMVLWL
jgi:GNAT superfamily N-acetyltransferase